MSQIRLYFDEDAGKLSLVQALRNSGQDVMTTSEVMLERYEIAKKRILVAVLEGWQVGD